MTGDDIETRLRMELWLNHGHDEGPTLYGDDGEMQCKACPLWDYRREPLEALIEQVDRTRIITAATKVHCDHGISFNAEEAHGLTPYQVREKFPRLEGPCPKGCGYTGTHYASYLHYLHGDW